MPEVAETSVEEKRHPDDNEARAHYRRHRLDLHIDKKIADEKEPGRSRQKQATFQLISVKY
tara:strand:- start:49 stop:231 length:183 start_codon:yes stop_codon:yes gene_type:complete